MACKNEATGTDADLNLAALSSLFVDEDKARDFLEAKRWPRGPVCPHCGHAKVYALMAKPNSRQPVRPGVYARSMPVDAVDSATLKGEVRQHVDPSANIMTDDWKSYNGLSKDFASHEVICHSNKQYARTTSDGVSIDTNTAESFFALLKCGHYGIFYWFSRVHTHRYCDEFGFRWDHRKVSYGERMVSAIKGEGGKRLMYRDSFADIDNMP